MSVPMISVNQCHCDTLTFSFVSLLGLECGTAGFLNTSSGLLELLLFCTLVESCSWVNC